MYKRIISALILTGLAICASARTEAPDSVAAPRPNLIKRIINYYSRSNVDRTFEKKIDWSIAPGPNYSSDVGLGLGFLIAGLYRTDRTDSITAPSNISIYGNITTEKFAMMRFSGDNILNHNKTRLSYSGAVVYFPGAFYGVGYTDGAAGYAQNLTTTMYKLRMSASVSVLPRTYLGVSLSLDYSGAKSTPSAATQDSFEFYESVVDKILKESGGTIDGAHKALESLSPEERASYDGYSAGDGLKLYRAWKSGGYDPSLADPFDNYIRLSGEKANALNAGIGLFAQYDSRDVLTEPHRGILLKAEAKYYPKFLGNSLENFCKLTAQFNFYRQLWRGGVAAYDLMGNFTFGRPSWHMYSALGGTERMRGYYEGRYRDRHCVMTQIELRQKVYRRHGVAAWFGAGNVWGFEKFRWNRTLFSFGCGYRFEFKNRMNIRLDYGWGAHGNPNLYWDKKRCSAFIFTASEAF